MMYSSYSALQRRQLTKQVYTDTQSSYLLVYAPGRHLALENSLANQLHRKFRLVTALEGELTDSVAGVLLVSEDVECTSTAHPAGAAAFPSGAVRRRCVLGRRKARRHPQPRADHDRCAHRAGERRARAAQHGL